MSPVWPRSERPLLFAHRGASAELPENTLPAFRRALELGAHVLELDVHPSADGVFVVSHDPDGARTCDVPRPIHASSWSEIATWDAGYGYVDASGNRPFVGRGIHPARLEQVLQGFPEAPLNIDVKAGARAELHALVALLRELGAAERVLLTSFSGCRLDTLRKAGHAGPIGLSRRDVLRLVFAPERVNRRCPLHGERAQIPTRSGPIDLSSRQFIARCHRLGLAVDYWVVNEPALARTLLARGADGIITDDTRALASGIATLAKTWDPIDPCH